MTAGPTVLLVDDDGSIREFVELVLRDEGYEVVSARHGAEALERVWQRRPDLILLDLRMPVMDGWEFARAFRAMPGARVPIVVFTVANVTSDCGANVDADAYLTKPFELEDLLRVVTEWAPRR